jgi:hypothetical protein
MQCQLVEEGTVCHRTYEIRLSCSAVHQSILLMGLQRFGRNRVIDDGLINAATVSGFGDEVSFLLTDGSGQRGDNACRTWRNNMMKVTLQDGRKLPEIAKVTSVGLFTRLTQRRFGWGDIQATTGEVAKAVHEESAEELLAMMPEARALIVRGEFQHLPAIHDALRSALPALTDCQHQLLTETLGTPPMFGPCQVCGTTGTCQICGDGGSCQISCQRGSNAYGFTGCSDCGSVQCKLCAVNIMQKQGNHHSFLRAYHEVRNTHTWTSSEKACDLCDSGPCRCGVFPCRCDGSADVHTMQCDCGAVRCGKCLHAHVWSNPHVRDDASSAASAPPSVSCTLCGQGARKVCNCGEARCVHCFILEGGCSVETWFWAHPDHQPATCHVTDLHRVDKSLQLEALTSVLGKGADLVSFAREFRELVGDRMHEDSQRSNCLKLYRKYAGITETDERGSYRTVAEARKLAYSMECQVPPGELEEFQKLWNVDAPRRCHEDHCTMPVDAPLGKRFCTKHADAGKSILCTRTTERSEDADGEVVTTHCGGKIVCRNGCRVCKACDIGADVAELLEKSMKLDDSTTLNQSVKRGASSLRIANNAWRFSSQNDPDHVASWTKKRRL